MPRFKRIVIACGCMEAELDCHDPQYRGVSVRYKDQDLHRTPELMTEILQEAVDECKEEAEEIVLGYGLCSNGVAGLEAPPQGLIIPRVHDCIALFLGSRAAYYKAHRERPGCYYLTPSWIRENKDPIGIMEKDYTPRVGREDAIWTINEELKHYTHIALIDTGAGDLGTLRARARENAIFLNKEYEEVAGKKDFFRKVLFGPYDDDFVKVKGGEVVSAAPFLD